LGINKNENEKKLKSMNILPIYFPKKGRFSNKLHIAIWNCGMQPQSFLKSIKDTRITIRKNYNPIFVIKKGDV
jgi:hypothetical protein